MIKVELNKMLIQSKIICLFSSLLYFFVQLFSCSVLLLEVGVLPFHICTSNPKAHVNRLKTCYAFNRKLHWTQIRFGLNEFSDISIDCQTHTMVPYSTDFHFYTMSAYVWVWNSCFGLKYINKKWNNLRLEHKWNKMK